MRVDSHLFAGYLMPPYYDSLLAKLIVWGGDRSEAMLRMRRALDELKISGVETNLAFQRGLVESRQFSEGSYDTGFVERWLDGGAKLDFEESGVQVAVST